MGGRDNRSGGGLPIGREWMKKVGENSMGYFLEYDFVYQ